MIPPHKVTEAERLLATGEYSQRDVAKMVGISRGSISAIANGTRHVSEQNPVNPHDFKQSGPLVRCDCGALTQMPCRTCYIKSTIKTEGRTDLGEFPDTPIGLDLSPEQMELVEEFRKTKDEPPHRPGHMPPGRAADTVACHRARRRDVNY